MHTIKNASLIIQKWARTYLAHPLPAPLINKKINFVPFFITGWLYRKKFIKVKNASLTIQRWARGYLARRKVFHIRRHHAAITMQRYIRGWVKRTQYLQAKDRTLRLQVILMFKMLFFSFRGRP